MYSLIRQILFLQTPEKIHQSTLKVFHQILKIPGIRFLLRSYFEEKDESLAREVFGLKFPNPVGLAAGFDKNAEWVDELSVLGFGFIEIGTVTPLPQEGNPKPRLFRLPKDHAIINRMGFNNEGVLKVIENLKKQKSQIIVGGNIGRNKITSNENAVKDYLLLFHKLYPYVDYFVINVSSPNTPDLRALQEKKMLKIIIDTLFKENDKQKKQKPILLKVAPDLNENQLDDIIKITNTTALSGLIISNTTVDRLNLTSSRLKVNGIGDGGLSGSPLKEKSNYILKYIRSKNKNIPIIAVGGIMSPEDAIEKFKEGADLIQIYTGLVYEGPQLIKRINKNIKS